MQQIAKELQEEHDDMPNKKTSKSLSLNKNSDILDTKDLVLEKSSIKFGLVFFSENTIFYVYLDKKSNDLKINIIKDLMDPFSPLSENILFNNLASLNDPKFYNNLNDKINNFIQSKNFIENNLALNYNSRCKPGACFSAAIYAGIDSFKTINVNNKGYYHLHLILANKNSFGCGFFPEYDYIKKYSSENEVKLFLPENNTTATLVEKLLQTSITLNIFCAGFSHGSYLDIQANLPTFFTLCNKTGGRGFYYSINNKTEKFNEDIKISYQKMHYDMNAVLSRRYFYEVEITQKFSSEFSIQDIFYFVGGNENSKISKDNKIKLASACSDFNLLYNFKYSKALKEDKKYSFQFIISYVDPQERNFRKIRVINSSIFASEMYYKVYSYIDIDSMVKLIFTKEICDSLTDKNKNVCCFEKAKENLKKRLVDALYFYKKNVKNKINKNVFQPLFL